ncbi:MAG: DEAD/DEAH box helicase [Calditrichaceae bacterium]|jgi:ATP-dependent RNA helicase DeaD
MTKKTPDGFFKLGLSEKVQKVLNEVGYETPTPIQAQIIPLILSGKDVVGQAQTGTGKTAAFALPVLSRIDIKLRKPQVLTLVPTRELAIQVAEAFHRYAGKIKDFQVLPVYGGQDIDGQLRRLRRGIHVVVGTPGRIMDHMRRGSLDLQSLWCLVLDEADEMLRMGFIDDVEWILEKTPESRQTALFSATIPRQIRSIAKRYLNEPVEVTIKSRTTTVEATRQRYWMVSGMNNKLDALTRILEAENFEGILVFVRTKTATTEVAEKLQARGYFCAALNGDVAQNQRERIVNRLKSGDINIIIATDVAARGLDVDRISHVINFDIPYDTESYVHRIGRTGRAGRSGEAILFVAPRERRFLEDIEKATRQKLELMDFPTTEVLNDIRIAKFKQKITDTLAAQDTKLFYEIIDQYRLEHNVPAMDIAAALAAMAQGEEPLLLEKVSERKKRVKDHITMRAGKRKGEGRTKGNPGRKSMGKNDENMEHYRIEVGRKHDIKPGNIVGAIANESGIEPNDIGRIDIQDEYSIIDMKEGIPRHRWRILKKVRVGGKELQISKIKETPRKNANKLNNKRRIKP